MHRNRAIRSKDEAKSLSGVVTLPSLVTDLVGHSRRSTLGFWKIYLLLYDFYLGNRNCAETLGAIAVAENEASSGEVLDRISGVGNRQLLSTLDSEAKTPPKLRN